MGTAGAVGGGAGAALAAGAGTAAAAAANATKTPDSNPSQDKVQEPKEKTSLLTKTTDYLKSDGVKSALISGGLQAMSSYMAAKAQGDDEAINALYGISPNGDHKNLTPDQVRFTEPLENRNSWRPRLMYDDAG